MQGGDNGRAKSHEPHAELSGACGGSHSQDKEAQRVHTHSPGKAHGDVEGGRRREDDCQVGPDAAGSVGKAGHTELYRFLPRRDSGGDTAGLCPAQGGEHGSQARYLCNAQGHKRQGAVSELYRRGAGRKPGEPYAGNAKGPAQSLRRGNGKLCGLHERDT